MKLGNIGDWGAGSTPNRSNKSYYENGDVLWVKTGELNDGYIFDSIEKITTKALNECSLRNNNIGDVLIAMYGATIGKLGITAVPLTTNQACCACTPFSFINNEYLFYYLMAIKPLLISKSYGGAQPNISKEKITNCFINFPKIDEQILIVNKIKELFKKIETIGNEYNSIINLISATKRKVLEEIFGENSSYKSYYENKIPITDDVEILDFLRKPINTSERLERLSKTNNTYPYYGATGQTGLIDDYLIDGEYVLLGEDGAPFLDKSSPKAYIINGKSWVNNHVHILKSKTNNKFLMYYLNWFDYYNYVTGTTRLKLNQAMLKKILIPNIPIEIKEKIVSHIDATFYILESII